MSSQEPTDAKEQVLSTLNRDGTRRWMRPRLSKGRFYKRRLIVSWLLMAAFLLLPYARIGGKPLILLDIPHRHFILFGTTFLPTDTVLLMLLGVGMVLTIFLVTALFGRVWCGWACPQTVYMEFLFRPIERLIEGSPTQQRRIDRTGLTGRRLLKYGVFLLLAMALAHTFLAYFVGIEQLGVWVRRSPFAHPTPFLVMAATTALIFFDFTYFREQTCIVACPYGRFQSVLLDRRSLIVGYDPNRGEPRGKSNAKKTAEEAASSPDIGDCIDCRACVVTCPTGIDIREGLQMECIHCTQCIDACDAIMDRIKRPRGLIRYSSQDELDNGKRGFLRPRVVIYPAIIVIVFGALAYLLASKSPADVTVLRGIGSPFTMLPSGEVSNAIRVKVVNRTGEARTYQIDLLDMDGARVVAPANPLPVAPGQTETANLFIIAPSSELTGGSREVRFRISDGGGFQQDVPYRLLGPTGGAP